MRVVSLLGLLALLGFSFWLGQSTPPTGDGTGAQDDRRAYDFSRNVRPAAPDAPPGPFREDTAQQILFRLTARPILAFVYSESCGVCWAMRPGLAALEQKLWGRAEVVYLDQRNIYDNYEFLLRYQVADSPAFLLLIPKQRLVYRWPGAPTLTALEKQLYLSFNPYPLP